MSATQTALRALIALVLLLAITQVMFQLGFRASFISPGPGWDCRPTWTYSHVCTDPDGREFR